MGGYKSVSLYASFWDTFLVFDFELDFDFDFDFVFDLNIFVYTIILYYILYK
jgi:hypothetical protein